MTVSRQVPASPAAVAALNRRPVDPSGPADPAEGRPRPSRDRPIAKVASSVEASERAARRGGVNLMEDPPEQQGVYLGVHPGRWPVYGDQADTVAWPHWSAAGQDDQGVCQGLACFEVPSSDVTRHRPAHSFRFRSPMPRYPAMHPSYKLHLLNIQGSTTPSRLPYVTCFGSRSWNFGVARAVTCRFAALDVPLRPARAAEFDLRGPFGPRFRSRVDRLRAEVSPKRKDGPH